MPRTPGGSQPRPLLTPSSDRSKLFEPAGGSPGNFYSGQPITTPKEQKRPAPKPTGKLTAICPEDAT
jgi:hypothetical protein